MLRKDYFELQIEQLGKVIAKVIADLIDKRHDGKSSEAFTVAETTLITEFNIKLDELIGTNEDELVMKLEDELKLQPRKLSLMGDLLYEVGKAMESEGNIDKAKALYRRTKLIYEHVNTKAKIYSVEREQKLEQLKTKI